MRKLQIMDAEVMRIAIPQAIGRSDDSHYDHRLHGVLLVANGQSCGAVADLFGEDARHSAALGAALREWRFRGPARGRTHRPATPAGCPTVARAGT